MTVARDLLKIADIPRKRVLPVPRSEKMGGPRAHPDRQHRPGKLGKPVTLSGSDPVGASISVDWMARGDENTQVICEQCGSSVVGRAGEAANGVVLTRRGSVGARCRGPQVGPREGPPSHTPLGESS